MFQKKKNQIPNKDKLNLNNEVTKISHKKLKYEN